ncbi:MAG: hypothetical protein U0Q16_06125 [Bryobacteraceae bacterium]
MKKWLALSAAVLGATLWLTRTPTVHSQPGPSFDDTTAAIRIQFGLTDKEPTPWDGTVSVTGGEVASIKHWRQRPGDSIEGARYKLATRPGANFVKRAWEPPYPEPQRPYLLIPGLIVEVKGTPTARVRVETPQGSFEVAPFALEAGRTEQRMHGRVLVDRVPVARPLSPPDRQGDFATILASPTGELWASWLSFQEGQNEVNLSFWEGQVWQPPVKVSTGHSDIFLVKSARDRNGHVWFAWAAQVAGNWDLYARKWDGKNFSAVERLTQDPQPDTYHAMTTDSRGNVWIVWQGFRNGKSDIFARRWDGSAWSPEERVSTSPANDWQPAIAASNNGMVYVGWDTYDKGNYDVMLRQFDGTRWSDPKAIAATPHWEAYVTLACDNENRLWAAWTESGHEWGKDTGYVVKIEGTPLYRDRWVNTAVLDNGQWKQTVSSFTSSLPERLRDHNDLPQLVNDGAGRMWLAVRHRTLRIQDLPSDTPAHRAAWEIYVVPYEGNAWGAPVAMPASAGREDMRTGFASGAPGTLYAAYATDHRDFEDFLYKRAEVVAARVPLPVRAGAPMSLVPRDTGKLAAFPIHTEEAKDLARIRGEAWPLEEQGVQGIYRGEHASPHRFSMDGNNDRQPPRHLSLRH